jgi:hypothetical protein
MARLLNHLRKKVTLWEDYLFEPALTQESRFFFAWPPTCYRTGPHTLKCGVNDVFMVAF